MQSKAVECLRSHACNNYSMEGPLNNTPLGYMCCYIDSSPRIFMHHYCAYILTAFHTITCTVCRISLYYYYLLAECPSGYFVLICLCTIMLLKKVVIVIVVQSTCEVKGTIRRVTQQCVLAY